jgi:hypothetical protein
MVRAGQGAAFVEDLIDNNLYRNRSIDRKRFLCITGMSNSIQPIELCIESAGGSASAMREQAACERCIKRQSTGVG